MKTISKQTKIVMTVGPASENPDMLDDLIESGVNVVRFNFSHGDHDEHRERMKNVKAAAKRKEKNIALLQDLGGPKIRIGDFEDGEITLVEGEEFLLTTKKCAGTQDRVYINYKDLPKEVQKGQKILIDDGTKCLTVLETTEDTVKTEVTIGGFIRSRRGVNVPGANLSIPSFTKKDENDISVGIEMNVDFFALSFVRSEDDIFRLREALEKQGSKAHIIAKIETQEAVDNINSIISASDGIMVARGDLAVEVPAEDVPHIQKKIINECNITSKPVIVATQMLESMIGVPVPTRAEISDVTTAVVDGADAVMLSGETAIGKFPLETVRMMKLVTQRTEKNRRHRAIVDVEKYRQKTVNTVAHSVIHTADDIEASTIIALTETGMTARVIARYRPKQVVVALSPHEHVVRQLALSFGCHAVQTEVFSEFLEVVDSACKIILERNIAKKGERVVIVAGIPFGESNTTNMMIVQKV